MSQPVQNRLAQIQPDAGGFLVPSSIKSGKSLFKHPWNILFLDPDARIFNDQLLLLHIDRHRPFAGILQRIGQYLLYDKGQPLLIRQDHLLWHVHPKRDLFQDKQLGVFLDCLLHDIVRGIPLKHHIRGHGLHPKIGQHHFHILLDLK